MAVNPGFNVGQPGQGTLVYDDIVEDRLPGKLLPVVGVLAPQGNADDEIVLVDDGSTDDTKRVLHKLREQLPERIEVLELPRNGGYRIAVVNANVPNMVGQISTCLGDAGLNIEDLLNKSIGNLAYTIVDVNEPVTDEIMSRLRGIDGVLTLRNLGKPVT